MLSFWTDDLFIQGTESEVKRILVDTVSVSSMDATHSYPGMSVAVHERGVV